MRSTLAAGCMLLCTAMAPAPTDARDASDEAASYLEAALAQIEQASRVDSTDWKAMRAKAQATIAPAEAKTTADTYPAIRDALATLGNEHGLLIEPEAVKRFNPPRAT